MVPLSCFTQKDPRVKERDFYVAMPSGHPLCDPPKAIRNMFCVYHQLQSMDNDMIMNSDLNP